MQFINIQNAKGVFKYQHTKGEALYAGEWMVGGANKVSNFGIEVKGLEEFFFVMHDVTP